MRLACVRWRAHWLQWAGCEQVDQCPHGRDGRDGRSPFFSAAKSNFKGPMVLAGGLKSKSALRLVPDWIDEHTSELERDWALAREGKPLEKIPPLD